MSFESITRNYLKQFQRVYMDAKKGGVGSVEMATRIVVTRYVEELSELTKRAHGRVVVQHDSTVTRGNRPDWRLEDAASSSIYCFGDHKDLSPDSAFDISISQRKQFQRYLDLGRPVFVFDGIEFIFLSPESGVEIRSSLIPKPLDTKRDWSKQVIDSNVEDHFRGILQNAGPRKWTEKQLIERLATEARSLSDAILDLLRAPAGSGVDNEEEILITALHSLHDLISEHHDPTLRNDKACADFIAQVLVFGLFYAHTRALGSQASERKDVIAAFWDAIPEGSLAESMRPFSAIVKCLSKSLARENAVSDCYQGILCFLSFAEYQGADDGPESYHTLFESFLEAFDSKSRYERGAFYTPYVLTEWMARTVDQLSIAHFGKRVMDAAGMLIDPCCGTGGFIEALIRLSVPTGIKSVKIVGFEILPAPYALAHYRIAKIDHEGLWNGIVRILLTDTLSDNLVKKLPDPRNDFDAELFEANKLSAPPIEVVIGNPPSTIFQKSAATRDIIEVLLDDFRPDMGVEATDRMNTQKALNNEAYRFLRWSAQRVIDSGNGIMALVLPGSFIYAPSFSHARKWLLDHFDHLYVLELDGDARTGFAGGSLFSVQQGRAVIFAVKNGGQGTSVVRHLSVVDIGLEGKRAFLREADSIGKFGDVAVESDFKYSFAKQAAFPRELWAKCHPILDGKLGDLPGIFKSKCSAAKLSPVALLFHTEKPILLRRSTSISREIGSGKPGSNIIPAWFAGQRKPPKADKLTAAVAVSLGVAAADGRLSPYTFRPFVDGYVLDDSALYTALSDAPGDGFRDRPEIRRAYRAGAVGIAVSPAPRDLGDTLTRFASFAWSMPDNDIASRGNAMIYCDKYSDVEGAPVAANITSAVADHFSFSDDAPRAALYYCYAVLNAGVYLDRFEGVLFSASVVPRIPIVADLNSRKAIAVLGEKAARLENSRLASDLPVIGSAVWPSDNEEFELAKFEVLPEQGEVHLFQGKKIVAKLAGISPEVLALRISGHNVIDKWLRERTYPYLRRTFKKGDLDALRHLIARIEAQALILAQIDSLLVDAMDSSALL